MTELDIVVDPAVFELRPDYRVLAITATGLSGGPSNEHTEQLLVAAERHAETLTATTPVAQLPQIALWRDAYRAMGAKPQRTRNSLEALTRRLPLPRINRLVDIYNAISVRYQIPIGGEDLEHYQGPPRLVRAVGTEPFVVGSVTEHPEPGEVIWRDDLAVTCRIWNWRQCTRTQLTEDTSSALFILDSLDCSEDVLAAVADALVAELSVADPGVSVTRRLLSASA